MKNVYYPIRAVAKLTGLSVDTLRAWERRYDVVKPRRDDRGRLYTQSDVRRLQLLRAAVEGGHAIGRLAALNDQQLQEMLSRPAMGTNPAERGRGATRVLQNRADFQIVTEAIARFDYAGAEQELNRLATLRSPRELIHQVAIPMMQRIGEDWHQGRLSIAQEHMVSALVRNLLGALVRLYARNDPPARLLFTTPSGEPHEFGVLSAAMLAAGGGLGVVYLGPNLPADEIVEAAKRTSVRVVALGVVGAEAKKELINSLRRVAEQLPLPTELWVGGANAESLARGTKSSRIVVLADFYSLEHHLVRLGARF